MKPVLTLLEGKWFPNKHVSVRDLFTPLFTVWTSIPDQSYHYEQFTNVAAFQAATNYAFQANRASAIYIGAHGNKDKIHGFHDEGINRTVIRNAFNIQKGATKRGVYFGSCSFVHLETAKFILPNCKRVQWIAGYHTKVDWIDSSVLDLCFFRHFLFPNPGRGTAMPKSSSKRLRYSTSKILADMGPLSKRLGFHVFTRQPSGGIVDLMSANGG